MTADDGQARDAGVVIALLAVGVGLFAYVYRALELSYHAGEAASPVAKLNAKIAVDVMIASVGVWLAMSPERRPNWLRACAMLAAAVAATGLLLLPHPDVLSYTLLLSAFALTTSAAAVVRRRRRNLRL